MKTITTSGLELYQFEHVLNVLLASAEAGGQVRRPQKAVVNLLDTMFDTLMMLKCQMTGGPRPSVYEIQAIKHRADCAVAAIKGQ